MVKSIKDSKISLYGESDYLKGIGEQREHNVTFSNAKVHWTYNVQEYKERQIEIEISVDAIDIDLQFLVYLNDVDDKCDEIERTINWKKGDDSYKVINDAKFDDDGTYTFEYITIDFVDKTITLSN